MKFVRTVEEALEYAQSEMEVVRRQLAEELPRPQKFIAYESAPILTHPLDSLMDDGTVRGWGVSTPSWTDRTRIDARKQSLTNVLNSLSAKAEITKSQNEQIAEHNARVRAKVISMMEAMGIPKEHYQSVYKRNKSTQVKTQAGYMTDLARYVPSTDGYSVFMTNIKQKLKVLDDWATKLILRISEEEQKAREEEQARQELNFLAMARVRYGLDFDANKIDVFHAIMDTDVELELAFLVSHRKMRQAEKLMSAKQYSDQDMISRINQAGIPGPDTDNIAADLIVRASHRNAAAVVDYDQYLALFGLTAA